MKSLIIIFLAATLAAALEETLDIPNRIINGTPAAVGQFPFQVGLSMKNITHEWTCGGSLISSEWVLTAGHCTYLASSGRVLLGGIHWNRPKAILLVSSNDIIQHEEFIYYPLKNDIALINIPRVSYTDKIQKIELPKNKRRFPNYAGKQVVISGWGLVDDNKTDTEILLYAEMRVISNEACRKGYWSISESNICGAPINGGNACSGDSGGPMILKDSPVLIGVTSFGYKFCEKGLPSVFTRVTSYLNWIAEKTGIKY